MRLSDVVRNHKKNIADGLVPYCIVIYKEGTSWDWFARYSKKSQALEAEEIQEIEEIFELDNNALIFVSNSEIFDYGYKKATEEIKKIYAEGKEAFKLSEWIPILSSLQINEEPSEQDEPTEPTEPTEQATGLQVFENAEFGRVRSVMINDVPYFVGKDVAEILGYERPDNAIRNHIDDEDKLMHQFSASGQNRNMHIINESGLYSLILSSKLPNAKKFKRWVTSEVLPSIRKNGAYATEKIINDPNAWIAVLSKLKEEQSKVKHLEEQILIMKREKLPPDYKDLIFSHPEPIFIGDIAKDWLMSENNMRLNCINLFNCKFKENEYVKMEEEFYKRNLTVSAENIDMSTQKGRLWLYECMCSRGHKPRIENK